MMIGKLATGVTAGAARFKFSPAPAAGRRPPAAAAATVGRSHGLARPSDIDSDVDSDIGSDVDSELGY